MSLITKYRPQTYKDVLGQAAACKSLAGLLKSGRSQAFIIDGPSGTGKTTLARIAAIESLGCAPIDIIEEDAATNTGIDAMRAIKEAVRFQSIGSSGKRAVIIDEAHRLSAQAWDALLKATEEPNEGLHWFFCTTAVTKIPATVRTRCSPIKLKAVPNAAIEKLLDKVATAENMEVAESAFQAIISEAAGSPRQALLFLGVAHECKNRKEVLEAVRGIAEDDAAIELARMLAKPQLPKWEDAMEVIKRIKVPPESTRYIVGNYLAAVMANAKSDKAACMYLERLEPFEKPFAASEEKFQLMIAMGKAFYQGG